MKIKRTGFQYIDSQEIILPGIRKVVIFGDPGCTGFYGESKRVLDQILKQNAEAFFALGDLAFTGSGEELREVIDFSNARAQVPIFSLCGNHDLPHYPEFLGRSSYALILDYHVCFFFDNSQGYFSEKDLDLLREMLEKYPDKSFIVLMHIPPPLEITRGSLPEQEWKKIKIVLGPHAGRILRIFCSHLHGFYEYLLECYQITLTAGGGAAMIHSLPAPAQKTYHAVWMNFHDHGSITTRFIPV
ncbi:MAG TPA: metallophosphoesterase [Candidatus Omnitrophota bacterium]|nr:metallophosphoesterase [Candidatus Omnitrophota bacterium]